MRPLMLEAKGLVSIRDLLVVDLTDLRLGVIAGRNGAGKSNLLNIITFALFGVVNGNKKGNARFIHDLERSAWARFTFALRGRRYRVQRTIKRSGASTTAEGLVEEWDGRAWIPRRNTRHIKVLDAWVQKNLHWRYETFIACVLLEQFKATQFFESGATNIVRGIIEICDLMFYKSLGENVRKAADRANDQLKDTLKALAALPEVGDAEVEAAREAHERAEAARGDAEAARLAAEQLLAEARELARVERDRARTQQEVEKAEALAARLTELQEAFAAADAADRMKGPVTSYVRIAAAHAERVAETIELQTRIPKAEAAARAALGEAQTISAAETAAREEADGAEQTAIAARSAASDAEASLRLAREHERLAGERARLDGERTSAAADSADWERVRAIAEQAGEVGELRRSLDALEHALAERNAARVDVAQVAQQVQTATTAAEAAAAGAVEAEQKAVAAEAGERAADARVTEVRASLAQITATLQERARALEADTCPTCARPMDRHTVAEIEAESRSLAERRDRAAGAVADAEVALRDARSARQAAERALRAASGAVERARHEVTLAERQKATMEGREKDRHRAAATAWRTALEVAGRLGLVLDNPKAPDAADRLQALADERDAAVQAARPLYERMQQSRSVAERIGREIDRLDGQIRALAPSPGAVAANERSAAETARVRDEAESKLRDLRGAERAARERSATAQQRVAETAAAVQELRTRAQIIGPEIARMQEMAVAVRADAEAAGWPGDREPDTAAVEMLRRVAEPLARLKTDLDAATVAAAELGTLRGRLDQLNADAERLAGRPDVETAQARAREAEDARKVADRAERDARKAHETAAETLGRRRALEAERDELDPKQAYLRQLVEPLGRKGLQSVLIFDAVRQILEHANDVLARISDDTLVLEAVTGEKDEELEIQFRDMRLPEQPRDFSFLSGAQRFRVSVAMALGIGQYLTRRSGAEQVEMLVIDEGLESMDAEALQATLDELERISHDIATVLVIAHKEEVQKRFQQRIEVQWDDERQGTVAKRALRQARVADEGEAA